MEETEKGRKEGKRGRKEKEGKGAIEKPASASHSLPSCALFCNLLQSLEDPEKAINTGKMALITPYRPL